MAKADGVTAPAQVLSQSAINLSTNHTLSTSPTPLLRTYISFELREMNLIYSTLVPSPSSILVLMNKHNNRCAAIHIYITFWYCWSAELIERPEFIKSIEFCPNIFSSLKKKFLFIQFMEIVIESTLFLKVSIERTEYVAK